MIIAVDDQQAEAYKEVAKIYERDDQMGLALYNWDKYLRIVPNDAEAKQHITDIRKPLLTKKQAEQMDAFEKKVKQAEPTPTPIRLGKPIPTPKPTALPAPAVQPQAQAPEDTPTPVPPAQAAPVDNAANQALNQPAPAVQSFMTPTPSTQLVPVDVLQDTPTPDTMGSIPK